MLSKLTGYQKERVDRIKNTLLANPPGICAERTRYYTQAYQEYQHEPAIIRRAKAFKLYLEKVGIYLGDDDLLAGYQASQPRCAPVFPEYSWRWVYDELDRFEHRKYDRFTIMDQVKEELRLILPWWKGRTLFERVMSQQPDFVKAASEIGVVNWTGQATSGEGHIVVDHQIALKNGFSGIINEARRQKNDLCLSEPDSLKKRNFFEAVEITFTGALNFVLRLAAAAKDKAGQADDDWRREELLIMAETCRKIAKQPASTFREALQTVWLVHLLQQMESNGHSVSLGRFDQYLFPYYQGDLSSGRLTREEALELIEHFYLKLFSIIKLRPESHSRTQSGYPMYQNLVIGGQTPEGDDATNDLSYICLAALADVRLSEPNFYIRCNAKTPRRFWQAAMEVVKLGIGMPAFVNDQVIVESLIKRGVKPEDALDYSTMGCLEVQVPGKWGYRANGKSKVNLLKIFEIAINNGCDPRTGLQLKVGRGYFSQLGSFDDLLAAWREQLAYYTELHVTADNIIDQALEEMFPNTFCSTLVHDCLKRGKYLNEGGAVYDMTSGALIGVPNVGNALAALKKIVYQENILNAEEVQKALQNNFAGQRYEEIRHILLNRAPKYGEDLNEADELTAMVLEDYDREISKYKNLRYGRGPIGGIYYPSTVTISANVPAGLNVGATPDGRRSEEPTADGVSPAQGSGKEGPTAIIQSVAKLPTVLVTGGQLLNMRINSASLHSEKGRDKLAALVQTFFDLKGWHIQINTVSTEVLREAQKHPERYKDLIVRVAGYSALFVALDPILQEDIIARLEHDI